MTTKPPLRIGLLGAGLIGREHATLVLKHPGTVLVALADPSPEAVGYAASLGVPHYASYLEMLDKEALDAVIVALPNALHVEAGLACVERQLPMLMEKPIAENVAAAMRLVDAAEAAGVPMLVGHHRRHSPDIREARRAVQAGELGDIVAVNGMWLVKKQDRYFDAAWRRQPGGGPMLINLIHDIDCLRYMCGDIESVQAIASSQARGFAVEDTAAVIFRFTSGALGTFMMSDVVPSPFTYDVTSGQALYFHHEPENCYYIGGRKGTLALPMMHLWGHETADGDWRDRTVRRGLQPVFSSAYVNQLENFIAVARREAEPVVPGRDAMQTLAVTLAVDRAAREGRPVPVAELFAET
ncbi:hypothetical protein RD110_13075 [Rhodoferax koreense]|uniref:Oxidoreductase n=1 Tax=Rhodoferax koreensis TaxID=1842727 RepID=A0A1P8K3U7_9BURK|nr:Gfo/Idh/MocA family oxidoreductase [Rhodoferax koreense]APW40672.1 hypothetical protein RD110_13075 [Rhodoferax koreense]